jgi:hypothetical protein
LRNVLGTRHGLRTNRSLTIIAQDPSVQIDKKILRATIDVPAEELGPGPSGYRVNVIDYDASANALYLPLTLDSGLAGDYPDPFASASEQQLLEDPRFHAQNAYAIVMRILARFELALGRRVSWGSNGHQIHVAPHAFAEPNAFYSREDRGLFFGYFVGVLSSGDTPRTIFCCLAHDVVAHETTHALLDGLRRRYLEPSSPDQAAFHEGFADVVALLSILSLENVVSAVLDRKPDQPLIDARLLTRESLLELSLMRLAEEMGQELSGVRGAALRHSVKLEPGFDYMEDNEEFKEEHRRGELLVAAMLRAFIEIWVTRLERIGTIAKGKKDRGLVVEEGAKAADHLLTMAIRAIDYCPPVDITFSAYLSALLTVDREVVPNDRYGYREALVRHFAGYGITPSPNADADGTWLRCDREMIYSRTHFDSMLRDEEEMFRFVWENRRSLGLGEAGYIEVQSVRPSTRIAPDGFVLRETVAEYVQILTLQAEELAKEGVSIPSEMGDWRNVTLFGGGTLIFDEYGQLKYQIVNHLMNDEADRQRQTKRIEHLWKSGFYARPTESSSRLADLHLARAMSKGGRT